MSINLAIDDAVDMELLDKIYDQYVRLSQGSDIRPPKFDGANLTGKEKLIAYHLYLKGISSSFRNKLACKPSCSGGSCPPCFGWNRSQYEDYLRILSTKSA
jgi:hypothetical protein